MWGWLSQAPGPQATSSGASQGDDEEDRVQPAGHATEHSEDEVDGAPKKHFDGGANGESAVQHHTSSSAAKEHEAPGEDDEQQPPPENHHRDADETAQQYASVNLRVGQ